MRIVAHHPLGLGLGTVGGGSGVAGGTVVTTDNTFLEIARQQGFEGVLLLVGGLSTLCIAVLRSMGRLLVPDRAITAAAVAGVGAFLAMCVFGEFIEQPGKVVAWTLLGAAVGTFARCEAPK